MRNFLKLFIISIFLLSQGFGQFGQNIVQYEDFNWKFIQSKHFDIYYYKDGRVHAEFVADEAEIAYLKISDRLNWRLKNRVSIIIYNSHNDFQQTNVVDQYMFEGIGGVTELFKNRIVIPFDGSHKEFQHVIHHELVHAFINDSVYGGSFRNMISSSIKVIIPGWMNEGLAEYLSSGWDTNSEMWIRDLAINGGEFPKIRELTGYMAYRGGQSVWNFITNKWGEESIGEIFYQVKRKNNLEQGIKKALGVDFKTLNEQWQKYLKEQYWPDVTNRADVRDIANQLTDHEKLENSYNIAPAISPDGSRIAIFSNKKGPMAIYLISAKDGQFIKKIVQGERSAEYEELHILKPGITWSQDSKRIAFAAKSGKSDALFVVNLKTGKKQKYRIDMEGIFRPAWRPESEEIAFIGNNGKSSDIYLYDLETESLSNLTKDWYSDDQISWSPDGMSLYFISDRGNDLSTGLDHKPENIDLSQTDIYQFELAENTISRLTQTPFNETYPCISNDGSTLAFISDEGGINNIFLQSGDSVDPEPITNIITGITQLSWNGDDTQLIFTGFHKSGYDIYMLANPFEKLQEEIEVPAAKWTTIEPEDSLMRKEVADRGETFLDRDRYRNYVFAGFNATDEEEDVEPEKIELESSAVYDSTGIYRTHTYKTRFTLDMAQAYYSFDSRYGGQGMAYFLFSDILGDHKIYLGTEMEVNLKRSDYFLFYRFLPYKIDWNIVFYHFATEIYYGIYGEPPIIRLYQNLGTNVSASKPLTRFNRIDMGLDFDHVIETESIPIPDTNNEIMYEDREINSFTTFIPSAKYVWDNALWSYTHPVDGARFYLKYRTSPGINKNSLTFHTATFDGRKYYHFFNGISFGGRLFAGTSWGPDAQKFRLGGLPWLFPMDKDRYYNADSLDLRDLYFSEYVMPIRGTRISQNYGNNVILGNLELRLPFLIYYFPAIKYLGQINGVLFTDFGVVWDNDYPEFWNEESWEQDNTGWLMSYGFGPRFILLGLPWQLDFAWQYNPHKGTTPERKWYLTIGLDF